MLKRSLKNWVEVAEIISAVAVVLSLMYVGFEIRRTTVQSDADVQTELLSYTHQRRYLLIENSELSELLAKGYNNPRNLTAAEAIRFQNYSELLFVAWERATMAKDAGCFYGSGVRRMGCVVYFSGRKSPRLRRANGALLANLDSIICTACRRGSGAGELRLR